MVVDPTVVVEVTGGITVVVVGTTVVVVVGGAVVVVVEGTGQSVTIGNEADAVKSGVRFAFNVVNVTVPIAGAGPLSLQINVVPDLPFVS